MKIIGRKKEQELLEKFLKASKAEFLAVYGRRRVGKTFLVSQFFREKNCVFLYVVGMKNGSLADQLHFFTQAVMEVFSPNIDLTGFQFSSWQQAFEQLQRFIGTVAKNKKIVLFFDELPWLATPRSRMVSVLDHYWNKYWVNDPRIKLIVCGSSASWMLSNIINSHGGLYNRITQVLKLEPFNLHDTQCYLHSLGLKYSLRQTLDIYMALGGIPHYLALLQKGLSPAQNLNELCFSKHAKLREEFLHLFQSLFDHAAAHVEIVRLLATKKSGMTRAELSASAGLSTDGGTLSNRLDELEQSGFIKAVIPWGYTKKTTLKLVDEYSLFYLQWIEPSLNARLTKNHWLSQAGTGRFAAWSGYAFEAVCDKHLFQLCKALNIPDGSLSYSWQYKVKANTNEQGTQIDLLFDRPDGVITLCEIKFNQRPYAIDKAYADLLDKRITIFKKQTKTTKSVFLSFITTAGLKPNIYSDGLVSSETSLEDLFADE